MALAGGVALHINRDEDRCGCHRRCVEARLGRRPVIAAQLIRQSLIAHGGTAAFDRFLRGMQPVSLVALLATLVLLFGFPGEAILRQPIVRRLRGDRPCGYSERKETAARIEERVKLRAI